MSTTRQASMRPPLIAGENFRPVASSIQVAFASMRPPLIAGENALGAQIPPAYRNASMRPPLIAGETTTPARRSAVSRCFNEAPADRGGKHPRLSSMRPPLIAGENTGGVTVLQ